MNTDQAELVELLKQVAEGVLKLKIANQELERRLARLEHVQSVGVTATFGSTAGDVLYGQRDIIGSV
jgi:hypothetical protein